jgi:predicted hydrocarbon binding protein
MPSVATKRLARFPFEFDSQLYRRVIADANVVIHCHHYNARLQSIIEDAKQIDGKTIFSGAAEEIFADYIGHMIQNEWSDAEKWRIALDLYTYLGYGLLDISQLEEGVITASESHFVEGWSAGFHEVKRPVCSFTEGFLQGAYYAITGRAVYVREEACMKMDADVCRFVIDKSRTSTIQPNTKINQPATFKADSEFIKSPHVDESAIIGAIVAMPFYGNDDGLIPAFNVYLANMPSDFYSLVCMRFLEAMSARNLFNTAKRLLIFAGEVCALNTLRGILTSPEWASLIAPMVKDETDSLHGLVAVTNALGWGNWHVRHLVAGESLEMESLSGYEALGYLSYRGSAEQAQCFMFTGASAGMMELLYREGTVNERMGTFYAEEHDCMCTNHASCTFVVEAL